MFFPPFSGMSQPVEDERIPAGPGGLFHGVYPAQVTDIADPLGQGRVRIRLPWSPDTGDGEGWEAWARIATLFAGGGRGSWFIPDVDDEVLGPAPLLFSAARTASSPAPRCRTWTRGSPFASDCAATETSRP